MPILLGRIEESAHPDGGVEHQPPHGFSGTADFALQHVVHKNGGQRQVAQKIMHPAPAAFRHQDEVDSHGGDDDVLVDLAVEFQRVAVGLFIGVIGRQRLGRARRGGAACQRGEERQRAQSQNQSP
jgi:hypothetical protein